MFGCEGETEIEGGMEGARVVTLLGKQALKLEFG